MRVKVVKTIFRPFAVTSWRLVVTVPPGGEIAKHATSCACDFSFIISVLSVYSISIYDYEL